MLLQLSHFFSPLYLHLYLHLYSPLPCTSPPTSIPHLSSCPWVVHVSSLASPPPPVYLASTNYASYSLYLLPHSPLSQSPLIILHVISISVNLFLF